MIILRCEQGTDEWHAARVGVCTASQFGKIVSATGKLSAQAEAYANELVAEMLMGHAVETYQSAAMQRGTELEPEARKWYEFENDCTVEQVGLVYLDDSRTVSCSPDGLVGKTGGVEIKCPSPAVHVAYLLKSECPSDYFPQVQGNLWVTGRKWWDFISYHPELPPLCVRVKRDEKYIALLDKHVPEFVERVAAKAKKLGAVAPNNRG